MRIELKVNERVWFVEFGEYRGITAIPEATHYSVKLVRRIGDSKIPLIKEVRGCLGLGLKEAKDIVELAPSSLGIHPKEKALEMKRILKPYADVSLTPA